MASKRELYELVGKCAINPTFMAQMTSDPATTALSMGIDLSPEQLAWLKTSPSQLSNFVKIVTPSSGNVANTNDCGTCIVDGH